RIGHREDVAEREDREVHGCAVRERLAEQVSCQRVGCNECDEQRSVRERDPNGRVAEAQRMAAAQEDREEWEERRVALAAGDEQLQGGATTSTAPTWFTRPAVAVRIPGRTTVLTLYLTPRRDVLLGVRVVGS